MKHRHFRLDLDKRIGLFWNGLKKSASIENISLGGVLVRADLPVKVGDFVAVHVEDESWPLTMELAGEIIRKGKTRRGTPAFALKFRKTPDTLRSFLHYLISNRKAMLEW